MHAVCPVSQATASLGTVQSHGGFASCGAKAFEVPRRRSHASQRARGVAGRRRLDQAAAAGKGRAYANYVERATAVAQEQYTSLLTGLQAVGQVKGWKVQQIVFVGGTCGSVHVESFNKNMKALGVLESKWDLIRQKLVRRLLEEQDEVLLAYFAQKGGTRGQRRGGTHDQGREHVKWNMYV